MVAVRSSDADRFAVARPADVWFVLVHGSDAGLISERVHALAQQAVDDPKDPFQFVRLAGDELAASPGRLLEEIGTFPLFGGRRAILVDLGTKNITGAFEAALEAPAPVGCTVIVEAGMLRRDAPVRQLVERARAAAAIECTADTPADLARLVSQAVRAAGMAIDADACDALVAMLGADRLTTRGEIEKLLLFAHGKTRLASEDVEAIVADASATVQDTAVDGAFLGNFGSIETTFGRVLAEGGDPGVLIGAALRHALLLHRTRLDIDNRQPLAEAAQAATRHGLFFKRRAAFETQLKAWPSDKLVRAIETLAEAIARLRREPRLAQAIALRALWSVALAVRTSGK